MDFYVGIASYKRPEASRTLDYLDSLGFPKERRILSVQTEEDRDAYTRSGLSERVGTFLYREASTAAGNRNTILLNVPEGTNVVFMDDDIKQVVMEDLGLVPLDTLEKFERMCKLGFATAQKNRTICFGLYPVANAYFMRGGYNTGSNKARALLYDTTMAQWLRSNWNDTKKGTSPARAYGGVLVPDGKDENGDVIYRYAIKR